MQRIIKEFSKGLFKETPIFGLILGLCPTLAVSTTIINGLGMGLAATFVLVFSNTIISSIRKFIPTRIRIPCFIVVIASFVTIVELLMKAYLPILSEQLGIFVPLIVVNCIILGRAEAFASKNPILLSISDGLGMGIGLTLSLVLISSLREILGQGNFLGYPLVRHFEPIRIFALAPGALLILGLLMGVFRWKKS